MELIAQLSGVISIYFAVYLWLFGVTAFECCLLVEYRLRLLFAKFSLVGLTFMLGLRWETGTDWEPYYELFKYLDLDTSSLVAVYSFDIGYVFFNAFVRLFSENYTIFLLINSALAIFLIYIFIKRCSPFPNTSILIFYTSYFVAHYMGSNRRIIAMGFLLILFFNVGAVRNFRFAAPQILAISFHRSSVMGIFSLLVPSRHFTYRQIFFLFSVCGAIGASQSSVGVVETLGHVLSQFSSLEVVEKMIYYGTTSDEHVSENVNVFIQTALALTKRSMFLLLFFFTIRRVKVPGLQAKLLNIYILGIAIYMIFIGSPIFQVLSTYFTAVEIGLIGISAALLTRRQRPLFVIFLFLYGILQLFSALNPYPQLYFPYISIFSETKRWLLY